MTDIIFFNIKNEIPVFFKIVQRQLFVIEIWRISFMNIWSR